MNSNEFDVIVENRIESIRKILTKKAEEYASEEDRLHNFTMAALIENTTKEKALWGMAMKHLISVIDLIDNSGNEEKLPTKEIVEEKAGDLINYLILLEAVIKERIELKRREEINTIVEKNLKKVVECFNKKECV